MMSLFIQVLRKAFWKLQREKILAFARFVPIGDLIFDRNCIASELGFGEGTTCYSGVLIIGDVQVGKNCWIGPNVVLDGSGGLKIGDRVTISAGSQIYTHFSKSGQIPEKLATVIEDDVYIGPNSVLQMGITVGEGAVIGALTFVNRNVPKKGKVLGNSKEAFYERES